MSGLGRGEEVVKRGVEVGRGTRCCVKVATRGLHEEQTAVVVVPGSGEKSDAIWHVPQRQKKLQGERIFEGRWQRDFRAIANSVDSADSQDQVC